MRLLLKTALLISLATLAMPGWAGCVSGDCKNGYGVWEYLGHRYQGDWLDGYQHGKGVYTYPDGNRYEGDYRNGKHHGKGVFTYEWGDRYEGDWVDGDRHGKGVYTYASGTVKSGIWEDGEFVRTVEEAAEQERIYRACILDKSKDVDMTSSAVEQAVQSTCRDIAKNPSWLDKLRY